MTGKEIDLPHMLARREARAREHKLLREHYHCTLISFTMNIPGPVKTNELIRKAFEAGKILLLNKLENLNAQIHHASEIHEDTGDELFLLVKNIIPETLKELAVNIENSSSLGRLYDIDIIDSEGNKLSRRTFRKCLICDKQAQECARSRAHTVQELQKTIMNILAQNFPS